MSVCAVNSILDDFYGFNFPFDGAKIELLSPNKYKKSFKMKNCNKYCIFCEFETNQ